MIRGWRLCVFNKKLTVIHMHKHYAGIIVNPFYKDDEPVDPDEWRPDPVDPVNPVDPGITDPPDYPPTVPDDKYPKYPWEPDEDVNITDLDPDLPDYSGLIIGISNNYNLLFNEVKYILSTVVGYSDEFIGELSSPINNDTEYIMYEDVPILASRYNAEFYNG